MIIMPFSINDILNSPSKLAVLRVLTSRKRFKATGRHATFGGVARQNPVCSF
jgi:hypothetical protein